MTTTYPDPVESESEAAADYRARRDDQLDPVPMTTQTPVSVALVEQQKALGNLSDALDHLAGKLGPAMGPERGVDVVGHGEDTPSRSPLVDALDSTTHRLWLLDAQVRGLLARVEL